MPVQVLHPIDDSALYILAALIIALVVVSIAAVAWLRCTTIGPVSDETPEQAALREAQRQFDHWKTHQAPLDPYVIAPDIHTLRDNTEPATVIAFCDPADVKEARS